LSKRILKRCEKGKPALHSFVEVAGLLFLSILSNEERKVGLKEGLGRAYERFLAWPRPVVLTIFWLAGVALVGLCALALYLVWQALRAGA
jgi:hypothetical protein